MNLSIDRRFRILLLAAAVVLTLAAGVTAWAWPVSAQNGESNTATIEVEQPIPFTQATAGWWHSCGLREDGTVVCWGDKRLESRASCHYSGSLGQRIHRH